MCKQKIVLLKITGEFLRNKSDKTVEVSYIRDLARQIKHLQSQIYFGIVVGGGNFFRGSREGVSLGMTPYASHQVGMIATVMNAVILQDIFAQEGLDAQLFSALECSSAASPLSPQELRFALRTRDCIIFAGGIGTPFFTTDTTAVVRAIQIDAAEIWKATKVDGVYTTDPNIDPHAKRFTTLSYNEALEKHLAIMDETAFSLARDHNLSIRVFSLFHEDALIKASYDSMFGSLITP